MFLTTAKASVHFDKLPDAAVNELGKLFTLTGGRAEIISKLSHRMQSSTYAELDGVFAALKKVAHKHGVDEAVTLYGP